MKLFILLVISLLASARSLKNDNVDWPQETSAKFDFSGIQPPGLPELRDGESSGPFKFPNFVPKKAGEPTGWPWNVDQQSEGQPNPTTGGSIPKDENGRIKMGVASKDCDDGKTHLERDWDGSPVNYTCFHPEHHYPEYTGAAPLLECVTLPADYLPKHFCMNDEILYDDPIPSYGDHRPIWPKFGEYRFVPVQRWLHSIEHGAVVMLYHPCAHPEEVKHLRRIVRECYGKHVITPSTSLPKERPLALVAWGCRYLMATVNEVEVIKFIKERSMKGPEGTYTKEGMYEYGLIRLANETAGARYDKITCDIPTGN